MRLQLVAKSVFSSPPKIGGVGGGMVYSPAVGIASADLLAGTLHLPPSNLKGELTCET